MKAFLFISGLCLLGHFDATTGQAEQEKRLEAFLIESAAGFGDWMKDNGYDPSPLYDTVDGIMTLRGDDVKGYNYYDLVAKFTERFYHGISKNVRATGAQVNLTILYYTIDIAFGDGVYDSVQGKYDIQGTTDHGYFKVNSSGNYMKTHQVRDPLYQKEQCELRDGGSHFILADCVAYIPKPRFENLTLNGFEASGREDEIKEMVDGWYNAQMYEFPILVHYYMWYMREVFQKTPIVDIIGAPLPASVSSSGKEMSLGQSENYVSKRYFDNEKNMWVDKVSFK